PAPRARPATCVLPAQTAASGVDASRIAADDHGVRDDLPSGTVTFVFTDVAGSTKLLHEHGKAYAELLAAHRDVVRGALGRHAGVEVDTQGDAFFAAFERASDAVAAATEIRDGLGDGPVRVRIGIHTGEPLVAQEG